MNDSAQPEVQPHEEPLFVLKYQDNKVTIRLFCHIFFVLLLCVLPTFAFAVMEEFGFVFLFVTAWGSFGAIMGALMVIDTVLFREIRLYNDRIAKVWKYFSPVEVLLANAKIEIDRDFNQNVISLKDRNTKRWPSIMKRVQYDDSLADKDDIRKLNSLLAELTGRSVEEFDKTATEMDPLIKRKMS